MTESQKPITLMPCLAKSFMVTSLKRFWMSGILPGAA